MEERRTEKRRVSDGQMERRIKGLEDRMSGVEQGLFKLSLGQETNNEQTREMYEIFDMGRSFFKVIGHLGQFMEWVWGKMKPILWMLALGSAAIYYLKTGVWNWPR